MKEESSARPGQRAPGSLAEFRAFREKMNAEILGEDNLVINRFFNLDGRAYEAGALDVKTKELLGLVASMVLRCDDCITYHVVRCQEEGITREQAFEAFGVGLVVGGSIVIPHLRRAVARWTELEEETGTGGR
ncbi:MAG TPA: carboxymuconolactone decarboxylase family protein [Gemmatimonadaceae bacterium]|nr:carboxymuconolactone decarboxylase family protein [Gemmatimonadaceae bacterium]